MSGKGVGGKYQSAPPPRSVRLQELKQEALRMAEEICRAGKGGGSLSLLPKGGPSPTQAGQGQGSALGGGSNLSGSVVNSGVGDNAAVDALLERAMGLIN
jgi:hypothetical protein